MASGPAGTRPHGVVYQAHVAAAKSGVNAIAPGTMRNTEGVRRFAESVPGASDRPTNPLGIQGHGSDIGFLTLFLCSPAARFVSGQVIAVDGASSTDMLRMQAGRI